MRVAVATNGQGKIAAHGGHCQAFMIFDTTEDQVTLLESRPNPHGIHAEPAETGAEQQCQGHHHHHGGEHGQQHRHGDCGRHQHQHEGEQGRHHEHVGLPHLLGDCQAVISRGMGMGLFRNLQQHQLQPLIVAETDPQCAVEALLHGELATLEPHACCQGQKA